VTVINGDTDTPGPLVSIPGWVKRDESGYTVSIYHGLSNCTTPRPAVWANQGTGSSVAAPQTAAIQVVTPMPATTATGDVVQKYGQCGGAAVRIMWNQRTVWQERHAKRVGRIFRLCMMECRSSTNCMTLRLYSKSALPRQFSLRPANPRKQFQIIAFPKNDQTELAVEPKLE
jgi:hypothetical protein